MKTKKKRKKNIEHSAFCKNIQHSAFWNLVIFWFVDSGPFQIVQFHREFVICHHLCCFGADLFGCSSKNGSTFFYWNILLVQKVFNEILSFTYLYKGVCLSVYNYAKLPKTTQNCERHSGCILIHNWIVYLPAQASLQLLMRIIFTFSIISSKIDTIILRFCSSQNEFGTNFLFSL